jgi:hypothetical protein
VAVAVARRKEFAVRLLWNLVLTTIIAALVTGCNEAPLQSGPFPQGRIEGTVRTGIEPVEAKVRATLVAARGDAAQFDVQVANNGTYVLDVPAGQYTVGVIVRGGYQVDYDYSTTGLRAGEAPPDTMLVDPVHSPVQVDFDLASMQIRLDLAPELNSEYAYVVLHRPGPQQRTLRPFVFQYGAEIRNGIADILAQGILPGTYKLEAIVGRRIYLCDCPYDGEHFWLPSVPDSSTALGVEVAPDQVVAVEGGVGPAPARLQGRISGAWQELGVEAPSLSLLALDSTVVRGERRIGNDGNFDERLYVPRPIKLAVLHQGIVSWIGGTSFETATVYDPQPGQTVSNIALVESGAMVEVNGEGDNFGFTKLQFYDAATMRLAAEWNSLSSSSLRRIPVPNLRPGNYRVFVDFYLRGYSQWAPQWYDRVDDPRDARVVTINNDGEVVRIPLVMQDGATISGTISRPGRETEEMLIYVTKAGDPTGWGSRYVTDEGSFVFQGLPNGNWKVGVSSQGRRNPDNPTPAPDTVWYPGTSSWHAARTITVRNFQNVTGISITLPRPRQ